MNILILLGLLIMGIALIMKQQKRWMLVTAGVLFITGFLADVLSPAGVSQGSYNHVNKKLSKKSQQSDNGSNDEGPQPATPVSILGWQV